INSKYEEVGGEIAKGVKVLMKKNHQVGEVEEVRGKKAIVRIGALPMQVALDDLIVVREKEADLGS
ncbi:MAG TPA: MutS2/Smr-associated SH3 domain-containing protein, partial [Chitinophagaceae bacterium]|nr:MutS2/Smr-associated SH3 domain-containing protein [Chitinophagaceae bacterium]